MIDHRMRHRLHYIVGTGGGAGNTEIQSKLPHRDFIKLQYASDFTSLAHFIQEENYILKQIY